MTKKTYKKTRRTDWTDRAVKAIEEGLSIKDACKLARISRAEFYSRRDEDPAFAKRLSDAYEIKDASLEAEAYRRAVKGTAEPIYHSGAQVGTIRRYSDTLLIFLMKGHNPAKWRDNVRLEGKIDHAHKHTVDLSACTDEEIEILERIAARVVQSGIDPSGEATTGGGNGGGSS